MEDKIRSLCAQILAETDDQVLTPLIAELRDALHQYVQRLREKVAEYPITVERRAVTPSPERILGSDPL